MSERRLLFDRTYNRETGADIAWRIEPSGEMAVVVTADNGVQARIELRPDQRKLIGALWVDGIPTDEEQP